MLGGAYAAGVEHKLGQVAESFVGDLVLVDAAVLSQPERLHGLLPDAVLVGGLLSAANNLRRSGEDEAQVSSGENVAPVLLKGPEPALWTRAEGNDKANEAPVALSDATFLPGRNGRPLAGNAAASTTQYCVTEYCAPVNANAGAGLRCACVLRGKYCSDAF